jgi:hypothetical protein
MLLSASQRVRNTEPGWLRSYVPELLELCKEPDLLVSSSKDRRVVSWACRVSTAHAQRRSLTSSITTEGFRACGQFFVRSALHRLTGVVLWGRAGPTRSRSGCDGRCWRCRRPPPQARLRPYERWRTDVVPGRVSSLPRAPVLSTSATGRATRQHRAPVPATATAGPSDPLGKARRHIGVTGTQRLHEDHPSCTP